MRNRQAIVASLDAWLGALQVGRGTAHQGMAVFPLRAPATPPLGYRTLAEALGEGWAEAREQPAACVPELLLINHGKCLLLVLDGEEIIGGRQNRIANASVLVAAGAQIVLPVSCVEHGRWYGSTPRFAAGEAGPLRLRAAKAGQVAYSLRMEQRASADQGAIWHDLAERQARAQVHSDTGAMHDLYAAREAALAAYGRAFPYVEGAQGMVVALNGHVAGADVFDQPHAAAAVWARLVRSYALDALDGEPGMAVDQGRALRFLQRARLLRYEVYGSPGLGYDVRLEGDGMRGAALVYDGSPVHVELFRVDGEQSPASRRRG
ncbi:MAG TPA: hypothetical protein PLJ35_04990 [Anaerolineae bacterium]|nr:hypothetical protein [Anaerolineae bacterium]HOQ98156.1 hypothetical protein [Anaerolineae bacterium]HPL29595.1 hypothetical protein [Anaerolineae bacterium]